MRRLIRWISDLLQSCMEGRYGLDGLSALYLVISASLGTCALNMAPGKIRIFSGLGAAALAVYGLYRCFSRDTHKQRRQWDNVERELGELDYKISLHTGVWKIKHSYRYIRCKNCGHRFRVPRKRGKNTVICPDCKNETTRRT